MIAGVLSAHTNAHASANDSERSQLPSQDDDIQKQPSMSQKQRHLHHVPLRCWDSSICSSMSMTAAELPVQKSPTVSYRSKIWRDSR